MPSTPNVIPAITDYSIYQERQTILKNSDSEVSQRLQRGSLIHTKQLWKNYRKHTWISIIPEIEDY